MRSRSGALRVLAVDRSARVRDSLIRVLSAGGEICVQVAADASVALAKMRMFPADLILLDLERPGGMESAQALAAHGVAPIACACNRLNSASALRLAGRTGIYLLPDIQFDDMLHSAASERLIDVLRSLDDTCPQPASSEAKIVPRTPRASPQVVAIGGSTGATEAVEAVLTRLRPDAPGVVVAIHMPAEFTRTFAARVDRLCAITVREAADGDRVDTGMALIAPGGFQTRLARDSHGFYVCVEPDEASIVRFRPSVDLLFDSFAEAAGISAIGVILTGMGDDGVRGLRAMREAGAWTIAQDEASCAVFGMPMRAIRDKAAREAMTLEDIATAVGSSSGQ